MGDTVHQDRDVPRDTKEGGQPPLSQEEQEALQQMERLNSLLEKDGKASFTIIRQHSTVEGRPSSPLPNKSVSPPVKISSPQTRKQSQEDVETAKVLHEWTELLSSWDVSMRKRSKHITDLALQGIPDGLRGLAWQTAACYAKANRAKGLLAKVITAAPEESEDYSHLLTMQTEHEKQIKRDIGRTFPNHALFKAAEGLGQEILYNVIKAYSCYDTEVGYCQGSPFIVAILLMHMPEEDAFRTFSILMRDFKLRGLFRPSMADLPLRFYQFDKLFKETYPELHAHFADMMVEVSSYASQWFLTLFGAVLPLPLAFRIMDIFLIDPTAQGIAVVFKAGLVILGHDHDFLLMSRVEVIMEYISRKGLFARYEAKEDEFMGELSKLTHTVTAKKLVKYEKDYITAKHAREKQEGESEVIKQKNVGLVEKNVGLLAKLEALEAETKMMAQKLLEKSVLLNEVEERLETTEELLRRRIEAEAAAAKKVNVSTQTDPMLSTFETPYLM
eukprot:m.106890 g.106890  ORF g.106890 m.106890 type:complete len:502 (-) comp27755_c0_seq1:91-1596(-)